MRARPYGTPAVHLTLQRVGTPTMSAATSTVERVAKRAADSDWADRLARLGFCARGLVYSIVGVIALRVAWASGRTGTDASKDGALREIAERPLGGVLLTVLAVGLAGYILWRASEAAWGKRDEDDETKRSAKRALSAVKALLYTAFLVSTVQFIAGGPSQASSNSDEQEQAATAGILDLPAGPLLVGAAGLGVIAAGGYVAYRGLAQKYEKRLDTSEMGSVAGPIVDVLGVVGHAARGLVFGVAGFLLIKAASDHNPDEAKGLDGTLKVIAQQAYGQVLLTVTAIGVIAYGLYSFAEARYRQL